MAFDEGLAQRLREQLAATGGVAERRMFGGLSFLVDGNLCVGVMGEELIARVGPDATAAALERPGSRLFDFTGRPHPARYAPGNQPRGATMSAFTASEIDYLTSQGLARLATVGPDGQPHVVPVTFTFNADEDAIDVGGVNFGATKKWRDARRNPRVTFLLDDVLRDPRRARAIEVRGRAEALTRGGNAINPRFPNFAEEFLRIRPTRIVSWGLEEARDGTTPADFRVSSRPVG